MAQDRILYKKNSEAIGVETSLGTKDFFGRPNPETHQSTAGANRETAVINILYQTLLL
ncbi:hypothetical protein ACJX0J_020845, partial [Zea mays]